MQIRRPTDPPQQASAIQLCGHSHRVGRLAAAVQIEDRVVDILMGGFVEVARPQPLQHVGDGVLAQQHAAQHGHLGGVVLRWLTPIVLTGRRYIQTRMAKVVHDSHSQSHLPSLSRTYVRLLPPRA